MPVVFCFQSEGLLKLHSSAFCCVCASSFPAVPVGLSVDRKSVLTGLDEPFYS